MNTLTYVLSSNTLAAGTAGIDIYESGPTNLTISLSGILSNVGTYQYLKFLVNYSDLDEIYTLQNTTDLLSGAHLNISRVFYPTSNFYTTYTIDVSGLRTDLTLDLYRVKFTLSKSPLNFYKDYKLVNSYLYSNQYSDDTLLVTVQADNPNYVGNFYIPYNKDVSVYTPQIPEPYIAGSDSLLRSEPFTFGGGMVPMITEAFSRGNKGHDFVIGEYQFTTYAMGTNEHDLDPREYGTGMLVAVSGNNVTAQDINGVEHSDIALIMVPEDGIDYSQSYEQSDRFRSVDENNASNVLVKLIFAGSDIQHSESAKFKSLN